jgi:hypothetical protein
MQKHQTIVSIVRVVIPLFQPQLIIGSFNAAVITDNRAG